MIVRRRTCAQFLGLLVCLSFLGGTAEAAPGPWITPAKNISLSAKSSLNNADVAVDGRGTAVAVWLAHRESENPEDYGTETIMAAVRPKGGKFGNPFALTDPNHRIWNLQAAGGPGGITVMWRRIKPGGDILMARTREPGGDFGPAKVIGSGPYGVYGSGLAAGPDGSFAAIWIQPRQGSASIVRASIRRPGEEFGPSIALSDEESSPSGESPNVAIARDGRVTAVWSQNYSGLSGVMVSDRPPAGTFGTPELVSQPGTTDDPSVGITPNGTTVVTWHQFFDEADALFGAVRTEGGGFGEPVTLSGLPGSEHAWDTKLAVANDGLVTLVWMEWRLTNGWDDYGYPTSSRYSSMRRITWMPGEKPVERQLGQSDGMDGVVNVTSSADGSTTVIWDAEWSRRLHGIVASTRPAGGSFSDPVELGDSSYGMIGLASARDGNAVAVWPGSVDDLSAIRTSSTLPAYCEKARLKLGSPVKAKGAKRAVVAATVATPGRLTVAGSRWLKPFSRQAKKPGNYRLKLIPTARATKRAGRRGGISIRARVEFDPRAAGCLKLKGRLTVRFG